MHIVHARGQPAGALIQARGGLGDGADDALIAALHRIERAGHLTDFVTAVQRHAGLQVAAALDVQHDVLSVFRWLSRKRISICEAASRPSISTATAAA